MANHIGGKHSKSLVEFDVCWKYFLFQFLIVFLFQTLLGAAASSGGGSNPFKQVVDEILSKGPSESFKWLGNAIPQQASFFLMFILTTGIFAGSIGFLRIPGAVIFWILTKVSGSHRQKKRCFSQQYASYGAPVAMHTIVLMLVFVFGVVQPFVALAGFFYFVVNYFYARYNLLYVLREPYETGGLFWPVVCLCLYFFSCPHQCTLVPSSMRACALINAPSTLQSWLNGCLCVGVRACALAIACIRLC